MEFMTIIFGAAFLFFGYRLIGTCIAAYEHNQWGGFLWRGSLGTFLILGAICAIVEGLGFSEKSAGMVSGVVTFIVAFYLFSKVVDKYKKKDKTHGAMLLVGAICVAFMCFASFGATLDSDSSTDSEPVKNYNIVGQKLSKIHAKSHDGLYYTDRDDSKLHYYTNDEDKITAAKYVFGADHYPVTSVQNRLENVIIQDSKLKYTEDKDSRSDFTPDGDSFNVYSPKRKKWYHVSMQRDDDDKVSQFTVWPGKSADADDF